MPGVAPDPRAGRAPYSGHDLTCNLIYRSMDGPCKLILEKFAGSIYALRMDTCIPASSMIFLRRCVLAIALVAGAISAAENDFQWHVVLAAVGNEQNVFDNFISDFGAALKDSPDVASITELHASFDDRWQASGLQNLERTLTALQPQDNQGCLVYLTGHGAPQGLALSSDTPTYFVRASRMESMLDSCAGRKTVLVVSACFSGQYVRRGITRDERIVMTASAEDLTSFGCSNNNRYTFFDQCFMDAWPLNKQWGALAEDVRRCVRETERRGNFPASRPQFFFGPGLESLAMPMKAASAPK